MKHNNKKTIAGLLGLSAATLLSGCGWFEGSGPAPHLQGARPGVDRTAPASNALPPPPANQPHEGGIAPADETRGGPALGSAVSGKGGQKAQKEEAEKQAEELSKKARERAEREAQARKATPPAEKVSDEKPASEAAPAEKPAPDAAPADKPATPPESTSPQH
jgi:hypothetical protein